MGFEKSLIYIENHGISIVFMISLGILVWKYAVPYFKENTRTFVEIRKYFEKQNHNLISGKGLELILNLTIQDLRWSLQKKTIAYIIQNNIEKNWDIIVQEINLKIEDRKQNFYKNLRDVTDKVLLKTVMIILEDELSKTEISVIKMLEILKEKGKEDKTYYEISKRSTETIFEDFENRINEKIKELLN